MILQVTIGDVTVTLDDEITTSRPTPEVVQDYATRLRHEALAIWMDLPTAEVTEGDED